MGARTGPFGRTALIGAALAVLLSASPAFAQEPGPLAPQADPLPFQAGRVFNPTPRFFGSATDTLSSAAASLGGFARLSRSSTPNALAFPGQTSVQTRARGPDMRTYIPQADRQPRIQLGPARAQLVPIETANLLIAAEPRGQEGVLMGFQLRLPLP
jgi:hypothetical protein